MKNYLTKLFALFALMALVVACSTSGLAKTNLQHNEQLLHSETPEHVAQSMQTEKPGDLMDSVFVITAVDNCTVILSNSNLKNVTAEKNCFVPVIAYGNKIQVAMMELRPPVYRWTKFRKYYNHNS